MQHTTGIITHFDFDMWSGGVSCIVKSDFCDFLGITLVRDCVRAEAWDCSDIVDDLVVSSASSSEKSLIIPGKIVKLMEWLATPLDSQLTGHFD